MKQLLEAIAEVRRERTVRQSVYPRLVTTGKLTEAEAARRQKSMEWAELFLKRLSHRQDWVADILENAQINPTQRHD